MINIYSDLNSQWNHQFIYSENIHLCVPGPVMEDVVQTPKDLEEWLWVSALEPDEPELESWLPNLCRDYW